jgi:Tol biopolymer transport system component
MQKPKRKSRQGFSWVPCGLISIGLFLLLVGILILAVVYLLEDTPSSSEATSTPVDISESSIAFSSYRNGASAIFTMKPDGANVVQVTSGEAHAFDPAWSPDGSRIAFASMLSGELDIYVINADGNGLIPLGDTPGEDRFPSWSPDGTQIVFRSFSQGKSALWTVKVDGSGLRQLTPEGVDADWPRWADHQILFSSRRAEGGWWTISFVRPDGSDFRQIELGFNAYHPDLYKNQVVFTGTTVEGPAIYVMDSDGSDMRRIGVNISEGFSPVWSPDGTQIVFVSGETIYRMNSDGTGLTQLTSPGLSPAWYR